MHVRSGLRRQPVTRTLGPCGPPSQLLLVGRVFALVLVGPRQQHRQRRQVVRVVDDAEPGAELGGGRAQLGDDSAGRRAPRTVPAGCAGAARRRRGPRPRRRPRAGTGASRASTSASASGGKGVTSLSKPCCRSASRARYRAAPQLITCCRPDGSSASRRRSGSRLRVSDALRSRTATAGCCAPRARGVPGRRQRQGRAESNS